MFSYINILLTFWDIISYVLIVCSYFTHYFSQIQFQKLTIFHTEQREQTDIMGNLFINLVIFGLPRDPSRNYAAAAIARLFSFLFLVVIF